MIFLDTGFVYAYVNVKESRHNNAKKYMKRILIGEFGSIFVSNFIYDEVLTLSLARTKGCVVGEQIKKFLKRENKGKRVIKMVNVNDALMKKTDILFDKYCSSGLSYTDCSIISIMNENKIEYLATFAEEFKGIKSIIGID